MEGGSNVPAKMAVRFNGHPRLINLSIYFFKRISQSQSDSYLHIFVVCATGDMNQLRRFYVVYCIDRLASFDLDRGASSLGI